jgi:DNA-binding NtrC family response regulator
VLPRADVQSDIIVIDDDLGFVFWLGHAFDQAGYRAFPARNVSDAMALASDLDVEPGLLIIGGAQQGAAALVNAWRRKFNDLQVIWLHEGTKTRGRRLAEGDWECRKPSFRTAQDSDELLLAIDHALAPVAVSAAGR